jgi:hypothetical protein
MKRLFCLLLIAGLCAGASRADHVADAGRAILKKNQDAVVGVKVVAKVAAPGRESMQEIKIDVVGVMVDATGLTVASLRNVEPSEVLSRSFGRELQVEISDLKLVLADRSEVSAALVLRDKDLDLAFLRPTEKLPKPAAFVSLEDAGKPELLDEVILLTRTVRTPRLDPVLDDARISAVIDKPRLYYVISGLGSPGHAVFTLDGKYIGQSFLRRSLKGDVWAVIVPAADIAEIAKQAPAQAPKPAPAEEKKPAEKKSGAATP